MMKIDTIQQNEKKRQKLVTSAAEAVGVITDMIQKLTHVNDEIDAEINTIVEQENALSETRKQYVSAKEQNAKVIERFKSFIE